MLQRWCEKPWPWDYWPLDLSVETLIGKLVFSMFVTSGPNMFYHRRIAMLDNNSMALVPSATEIGDIVSEPIKDRCHVPIVFRQVLGMADEGLEADSRLQVKKGNDILRRALLEFDQSPGRRGGRRESVAIDHVTVIGECFAEKLSRDAARPRPDAVTQILVLH